MRENFAIGDQIVWEDQGGIVLDIDAMRGWITVEMQSGEHWTFDDKGFPTDQDLPRSRMRKT